MNFEAVPCMLRTSNDGSSVYGLLIRPSQGNNNAQQQQTAQPVLVLVINDNFESLDRCRQEHAIGTHYHQFATENARSQSHTAPFCQFGTVKTTKISQFDYLAVCRSFAERKTLYNDFIVNF
jgi:hypothetical protein